MNETVHQGADTRLTIGQVVETLRSEFPSLSISKVRYLEERGLLSPERTRGGYRTYLPADVRRLRTILSLQRDEFLPLEVIRERLARGLAGIPGAAMPGDSPSKQGLTNQTVGEGGLSVEGGQVPWQEALEIAEVTEDYMRQLVEFHLVDRQTGPMGETVVSELDVQIARICGLLSRFGVEPRNLRLTRSAVEREVAIIEQVAAPALRSAHRERREEGEQVVREMTTLLVALFRLLLTKDARVLIRQS